MSALYRSAAAFIAVASLYLPATITPASARGDIVAFNADVSPGTIVVRTNERRLYLVLGQGRAMAYPVGVGRAGRQWAGRSTISGKHIQPAWTAPPDMARENPRLGGRVIPGGSPQNPMGVAAMTLSGGDYAIHGTNNPGSIGGFVSYGCIRMYNQDITDLIDRVSIGSPVIVTR
jgi:lipoprotein-anchoring transpeptidase ErfK/SrfK